MTFLRCRIYNCDLTDFDIWLKKTVRQLSLCVCRAGFVYKQLVISRIRLRVRTAPYITSLTFISILVNHLGEYLSHTSPGVSPFPLSDSSQPTDRFEQVGLPGRSAATQQQRVARIDYSEFAPATAVYGVRVSSRFGDRLVHFHISILSVLEACLHTRSYTRISHQLWWKER